MRDGSSFIYHLAEGTSSKMRDEYELLARNGCAQRGLIGIHCTALEPSDYVAWSRKAKGEGTVVWSPFSNIWLYGDTTDVLSARRHMRVCLGSDWSPSGTRQPARRAQGRRPVEHRRASRGALSPLELCEMATREPGLALESPWGRVVGRLEPGALADIAVMTPADVRPVRVDARRERTQREAGDRRRRARVRRRFADEGRGGHRRGDHRRRRAASSAHEVACRPPAGGPRPAGRREPVLERGHEANGGGAEEPGR